MRVTYDVTYDVRLMVIYGNLDLSRFINDCVAFHAVVSRDKLSPSFIGQLLFYVYVRVYLSVICITGLYYILYSNDILIKLPAIVSLRIYAIDKAVHFQLYSSRDVIGSLYCRL